ncbi:MAG TPA: energy transducer TonB [Pyrinomonadaceae bacterium]|nr:energy transducer TonB [Pyrinomonadaceae bacterium]
MKERTPRQLFHRSRLIALFTLIALTAITTAAQTASDAEAMQRRLMRARALAAAHNLSAAAAELDNIRNTATDDSIRDVARIMLMGVYLEGADYARAQALLEETYKGVAGGNESSIRAYFTLAGQSVKGAREHLDRYKAFGLNIADKELPPEAAGDLDRLRALLERVAEQAKQIGGSDARNTEAIALLEDAASVRATLARNRDERVQWQTETTDARQKLAVSETRVASLGPVPVRPASTTTTQPASSSASPIASNNASPGSSSEASAARNTPLTRKTVSTTEQQPKTPKQEKPKQSQQTVQPTVAQTVSAPADGQPLQLGSLIDKATQRIAPSYPTTAKTARVQGVVRVFVIVDENGTVSKVERSDGPSLLRAAAETAARQWRFQPQVIDGKPIRMTGYISFNFTL